MALYSEQVMDHFRNPRNVGYLEQALQLTNRAVIDALGGLPAHKIHCSVLAEQAIHAAIRDYYDKNGIAYDAAQLACPCCCE